MYASKIAFVGSNKITHQFFFDISLSTRLTAEQKCRPSRLPQALICRIGGCAVNKIAFEGQRRSSLETAVLVSDRWSLHILRECFLNFRRFESFQSRLKIPSAKLTERLERLIDEGLLRRVCYQETPRRYEYILTNKGLDLYRTVFSLLPLRGRRSRLTGVHDRRSGGPERTTIFDGMTECPDCGEVLATEQTTGRWLKADGLPSHRDRQARRHRSEASSMPIVSILCD
jgi:DNA-binding HxlR family transcriptional regulator